MDHKPRKEPDLANDKGSGGGTGPLGIQDLDPDNEQIMEMLLAACLAMPRPRLETAIDDACTQHPHLAPHLRHRYVNLLQMGILEQHEEEEGLSGESTG